MEINHVDFKLIDHDNNEDLYIVRFDTNLDFQMRRKIIDIMRRAANRYIAEGKEEVEISLGRTITLNK